MLHASGLLKELWAEACNTGYTYSTVLDLHQRKVRRLWNYGLDWMQLLVIHVFWGQNVMCTLPNRKGTSGTRRIPWAVWSYIWVKRTAIEFVCLTNGRLCSIVMSSLSQKLCAIRTMTSPKPKACVQHSMLLQLKKMRYRRTTEVTTETLRLLQEEVMVRIQKFTVKTAKAHVKRNGPFGWLVANSYA